MSASMADVIAVLARAYPPELAESWDAVGLVCGDPDQVVSRVLIAVDPVPETVAEAVELSAQLLVTHHPLLLRGVHGVPADTPKGALVHRLIRTGVGLYTAHTNADSADPGVSDALAEALGVTVAGPLQPRAVESQDKLVTTVPPGAAADRLVAALTAVGATALADSSAPGDGGRREFVLPRRRRRPVVEALRDAHPEPGPVFDIVELVPAPGRRGLGRVGELSTPETLAEFTQRAADALPATAWGVRAAGDPDRLIRRVAVCGGAGDSAFDAATASGADVYLTADLRHHPASEHVLAGSLPGRATPALVDVAHWSSEHPWCHQAASVIERELGSTVEVCVSWRRTDPWTLGRT